MTNHHTTHFFNAHVSRFYRINDFTLAQNGYCVRYCFDFIQFVRDKDNGFAFLHQRFHDLQQFFNLLWGQNRRRLIKN